MNSPAVCPYCRMPFDEKSPPKIFCTACGMPHHEDCYMENGGCTVFGCAQTPAEEPKLQVSYSDLNAVPALAQPAMPAQSPQSPASAAPSPNPYGGPLGLAQTPAVASPVSTATAGPQPPATARPRSTKSRTAYIVLGVFLGAFGAHNFYAGYTGRAVGQLCLSVFTAFYLAIASWIWAIVEICVVDKDSSGLQFS